MKAKDIMTRSPACCAEEALLPDVARMMVAHDCGEIPVIDESGKLVGVITDRDIVCRTVAKGRNPLEVSVRECMTSPAVSSEESTTVHDCCELMEEHQIRRLPIVDATGRCCGIISQADIALHAPRRETAALVRDVSTKTNSAFVM